MSRQADERRERYVTARRDRRAAGTVVRHDPAVLPGGDLPASVVGHDPPGAVVWGPRSMRPSTGATSSFRLRTSRQRELAARTDLPESRPVRGRSGTSRRTAGAGSGRASGRKSEARIALEDTLRRVRLGPLPSAQRDAARAGSTRTWPNTRPRRRPSCGCEDNLRPALDAFGDEPIGAPARRSRSGTWRAGAA